MWGDTYCLYWATTVFECVFKVCTPVHSNDSSHTMAKVLPVNGGVAPLIPWMEYPIDYVSTGAGGNGGQCGHYVPVLPMYRSDVVVLSIDFDGQDHCLGY